MPLVKKAVLLSLILLLHSGAGIFGSAMILDTRFSGLIQQGVTVKGIPIGGLKPVEAALKLQDDLPSPPGESALKIEDAEKSYIIKLSDIDARYDFLSTTNGALEYINNKEKYINQLISVLRLRAAPEDLAPVIAFSEEKLEGKIKNLKEEWDTPPQDAVVSMSDDQVIIIAEKVGYSLDFEKTLEQTRQELARGNLNVAASMRVLNPNITSIDLEGVNALLGEYITVFDVNAANRSHNIALASATVNGSILRHGEIFSLNERLGPRLAETGYLMAPVFIEDSLALDIGGGICQVATTLYNAVIFADLPVEERYPHPLPVNYAPPDRDATIAGDYLDFKFSNNMNTPLYISSLVEGRTLTMRIFGEEKNRGGTVRISSEKVVIDPKIVIIQDNTLLEGETRLIDPGKPGYETRVYQEVVVDGKVNSKTLISSDYFKPEDKIIHVNQRPHEEEK